MSKARCGHGRIWYRPCRDCGDDMTAIPPAARIVLVPTFIPFVMVEMLEEDADNAIERDRTIRTVHQMLGPRTAVRVEDSESSDLEPEILI